MTQRQIDDRSAHAKAMSKVSEIISMCLMPVIPTLIGIWLDRRFETTALFTVGGLAFGLLGAFLQIKQFVSATGKKDRADQAEDSEQGQSGRGLG